MSSLYKALLPSPIGYMEAVGLDEALLSLKFYHPEYNLDEPEDIAEYDAVRPEYFARLERAMEEYWRAPVAVSFDDIPLANGATPSFTRKIYSLLRDVKCGQTVTYSELARVAGNDNAQRAVGGAMASNDIFIIIPCHRVLPASGGVGNYGGDPKRKEWLLKHEGAAS